METDEFLKSIVETHKDSYVEIITGAIYHRKESMEKKSCTNGFYESMLDLMNADDEWQKYDEQVGKMVLTMVSAKRYLKNQIVRQFKHDIIAILSELDGYAPFMGVPDVKIGKALLYGNLQKNRSLIKDEDWGAFKVLRCALNISELKDLGFASLMRLQEGLLAYHLDWYIRYVVDKLNLCYIPIYLPQTYNTAGLIKQQLMRLLEQMDGLKDVLTAIPTHNADKLSDKDKSEWLQNFTDKEYLKDMVQLFNDIGREFHIGSKACSKRTFAMIAFILQRDLFTWSVKSMRKAQQVLGRYYSVPPTEYKANDIEGDIADFIAQDKSRLLSDSIVYLNKKYKHTEVYRYY